MTEMIGPAALKVPQAAQISPELLVVVSANVSALTVADPELLPSRANAIYPSRTDRAHQGNGSTASTWRIDDNGNAIGGVATIDGPA